LPKLLSVKGGIDKKLREIATKYSHLYDVV